MKAGNYIIAWKSKITGKTGKGTTRFGIDQARAICNRENEKHPDIEHSFVK